MKINKENCTQTVNGRVKELKVKGQDFPTMITVEYQVAGNNYVVTESLKLKSEKIKLGVLAYWAEKSSCNGQHSSWKFHYSKL